MPVGPAREHDTRGVDLLGLAEQDHHRIDRVDADVHHRPVRHLGAESVQDGALLELVVARGVLAVAGEITTDRPQPVQGGAGRLEIGRQGRFHRLHQCHAITLACLDHRPHLLGVRGERLLAQDVFPTAHAEDALLGVQEVGRRNIDRVDQRTFGHGLERCEGMGNLVLGGELIRPFLGA